ncbi:MAG: sporulation protein YhbH [Mycobacterium leprae]
MSSPFHVAREDWSLHRQGQMDQERHLAKVREAIKKNLADIISEEAIITGDGNRTVRVPIRSLNEYRFRYDWNKRQQAGQGPGSSQVGEVVAGGSGPGQRSPGKGDGAGDQEGEDYYETDVTIDNLGDLIFEDLCLPRLDPRKQPDMTAKRYEWEDVRKTGLRSNIDKKRTIMEAMKRNLLAGRPPLQGFKRQDMRYRVWEEKYEPQTSAVVLAMMDTSGSMGEFEKYIARGFFFWMVRFLRTKYDNVIIHFLAHSTEAKEVTEEEFFTKGESGGTRCSSVYDLALRIIQERYPPSLYNLYPFHFSDGDNLSSDNQRAVELVMQLLAVCNMFGYGEIDATAGSQSYYHASTLNGLYKREIDHPRFASVVIKDKTEVYQALQVFFGPAGLPAQEV